MACWGRLPDLTHQHLIYGLKTRYHRPSLVMNSTLVFFLRSSSSITVLMAGGPADPPPQTLDALKSCTIAMAK